MKKIIRIDYRAEKELNDFSRSVQFEFKGLFRSLEIFGKLELPKAKKLNRDLYEIRVKLGGEYRGFYAYIKDNYVIVLHLFRKKSQKTPIKNLKLAGRRLKDYEQ